MNIKKYFYFIFDKLEVTLLSISFLYLAIPFLISLNSLAILINMSPKENNAVSTRFRHGPQGVCGGIGAASAEEAL